ncbi:MAG: lipoyl(octanoyl) transferase LipB [Balneola sp.]|nr:lipoyl(octanoyl) transferase LipB [Balneola sp.]MBO6650625.1 lipoyl(octanoyl) transferase LipB [Balneola sp.]MBO6712596.1 lipoyl(octanoyl) transferase LipB [Balneola sp.]MBO6800910.1 lipoyl(octanoyl) transferase LipB [Balneola sp.]MBO6870583.1 lipoyl(octanoyl) transferase LipB [Balneola sp.]
MSSKKTIQLYDLGLKPYQPVWDLQHKIQQRIIDEKKLDRVGEFEGERKNDVLLFVEHPHVYTLGKSGDEENLLRSLLELQELEAEYVKTNRGGDITYHGPGQIVGYPILDLDRYFTDIHKYLRFLEEVIIKVCADYGFEAQRIDGLTGVWIGEQKICAMGIRCSRWVTMHGFALNVNTNLQYFNNIVPCGIEDKEVTSLQKLLGREIDPEEVKKRIVTHFENVFDVSIKPSGAQTELEKNFL